MSITKNTPVTVVLPQCGTVESTEKFAAEEIVKYFNKICGATVTVAHTPSDNGYNILIGSPARSQYTASYISEADFNAACPGPEGIYLASLSENTYLIAGSDDSFHRSTVYAVYELLERFLGASLAAYINPDTPGGEIIPVLDEIDLSAANYIKSRCDLVQRGAVIQYENPDANTDRAWNLPFLDWLCKNRYNQISTWTFLYDQMKENGFLDAAISRGMEFAVGFHDLSKMLLPTHGNKYFPEHYYETHPEFYRLQEDGTRFMPKDVWSQWIFCSRNEELIETLINNIKAWLRPNPQIKEVLFYPNDGISPQCYCEECSKYTKTENYIYVINRIAKAVRREFPDIIIQALAYVDVFECPENVALDECVCIEEAVWHSTGLRKGGKPDGSTVIGTFLEDNLINWHNHGASVRFYEYYMGVYQGRQRWLPMADEIQARTKRMVELGFLGWVTQIEGFNHWNNIFNFYCFARTAYDTDLTMEDNLARFSLLFGEGAPEVAEVIRYAEDFMDGQCELMTASLWMCASIDKERIYRLFDEALSKTTSPACRNNIRMMRMAWRYTDLEASLPEAATTSTTYDRIHSYTEPTGELMAMTEFDSLFYNEPGFGIAIPARSTVEGQFEKNIWYLFDEDKTE